MGFTKENATRKRTLPTLPSQSRRKQDFPLNLAESRTTNNNGSRTINNNDNFPPPSIMSPSHSIFLLRPFGCKSIDDIRNNNGDGDNDDYGGSYDFFDGDAATATTTSTAAAAKTSTVRRRRRDQPPSLLTHTPPLRQAHPLLHARGGLVDGGTINGHGDGCDDERRRRGCDDERRRRSHPPPSLSETKSNTHGDGKYFDSEAVSRRERESNPPPNHITTYPLPHTYPLPQQWHLAVASPGGG